MKEFINIRHNQPVQDIDSVKAKAYYIEPIDSLHHFVFTSVHHDKVYDEKSNYYDLLSICEHSKIIYGHEGVKGFKAFQEGLFEMLKNETSLNCAVSIADHTAPVVLNYVLSLESVLAKHTLESAYPNVKGLLHQDALLTIRQLGLPIVPRIYNWLVEAGEDIYPLRKQALLTYPILLIPIATPMFHNMMNHPLGHDNGEFLEKEMAFSSIFEKIDGQLPFEPALSKEFNLDQLSLAKLKNKQVWQITEKNEPKLHKKLKEQLDMIEGLQASA
jgi:hypothetical protein